MILQSNEYLLKQSETFFQRGFFVSQNIATHGRVGGFCIESGNISTYLDRVEQFFIANDIAHGTLAEIKCKAILVSILGEETYNVTQNISAFFTRVYIATNLSKRGISAESYDLSTNF